MNLKTKTEFIRNGFRNEETKESFVFQFLRSIKGKSESDLTPQEEKYLEAFLKRAKALKKLKNKKK